MKKALAILFIAVLAATEPADAQQLVDRQTGKYLGDLGGNKYSPNSTSNPYGRYGSEYSADSINNPYGQYGSKYSNDSPNNPYAGNAPAIVSPGAPMVAPIPALPSF
jgi:hypothetical protein